MFVTGFLFAAAAKSALVLRYALTAIAVCSSCHAKGGQCLRA